jgi:hypothetical protein
VAIKEEVALGITADASGVVRGVAVAQGALRGLQAQLGSLESLSAKGLSLSGVAGIGLSATAAAVAVGAMVKVAADYGDQLDNMAQRTGVAVEELARLQYAAKLSDTSTEALGKGIGNLSKLMVGAAYGGAESGKLFERFGISLRNADGTMRSTTDVLYDLSDVFTAMPEGPEKTALAMDIFGKKMGAELIPLLNQGSAGLRELGDEAERFGLVLNAKQTKAAADFNDNLDRLSSLSKSVVVNLGNLLIPTLNQLMGGMNDASKSSDGFVMSFLKWPFVISELQKTRDAGANIERLTKQIDALKAKMASGQSNSIYGFDDGSKAKLEQLEAEKAEYVKLNNKKIADDDAETAGKRKNIAAQLAREVESLEQLKAVAAGKASADILKSDKERTDEQIKNAEKLRGALQSAWETSRKEAQKAADDAQKLLDKASGVRTSASDKATELRNAGLSDEEKQALAYSQAQEAQGQGAFYAAAAGAAQLDGRTKDFEKYQKQAESFLDRAMKFAEASGNADMVETVGNAQAGVIEKSAKAKQNESAALEAQATAQAETLKKLDTDIEALKQKAANIAISADISQAEGRIGDLRKKLEEIPDKTVTITVKQVGSPEAIAAAASDVNKAGLGGFAGGGWTGPGGKFKPAGIVHAEEFVTRSEVVRQPGALSFLSRFNRVGMQALRGYAGGGLVSDMAIPSLTSSAMSSGRASRNLTLVLGNERFGVSAADDVIGQLESHVSREALRKGGRR